MGSNTLALSFFLSKIRLRPLIVDIKKLKNIKNFR